LVESKVEVGVVSKSNPVMGIIVAIATNIMGRGEAFHIETTSIDDLGIKEPPCIKNTPDYEFPAF